jgi:hypothetical protein
MLAPANWTRESFPGFYRAANSASQRGQKLYLRFVRANLVMMVVGALLGTLGFSDPQTKQTLLSCSAVVFTLGLAVSALLAVTRWDKDWYAGRAIAESIKSLSWKFVCCAEPFPEKMTETKAIDLLVAMLQELLRDYRGKEPQLLGDGQGAYATDWMKASRKESINSRRDRYLDQRVQQQRNWYGSGSTRNKNKQGWWFFFFLASQAAAVGAAVVTANNPMWTWQPSGLFAAIAAAIAGWGQVKRFQELTQAYGQAALELDFIAHKASKVVNAAELSRFVADAETAISREHTAWVARRETA